jgi:hypothetical protein
MLRPVERGMRRLVTIPALLALLVVTVGPATAADVYVNRASGVQLLAESTLWQINPDGTNVPGTYIYTSLVASELSSVNPDGTISFEDVACAQYSEYLGEATSAGALWILYGCASFDGLGTSPALQSARVTMEIPVTYCYDNQVGECEASGMFAVDLTFEGTGKLETDGGSPSTTGEPGMYRNTNNGIYLWRTGTVRGDIMLEGSSVLVGGAWTYGDLQRFRYGDRAIFPKG